MAKLPKDMRLWLQAQGHPVGERGRIAKPLQDEYWAHKARERSSDGIKPTGSKDPKVAEQMQPTGKSHRMPCGFCADGHHNDCPGMIARAAGGKDWYCICAEQDHKREHKARVRGSRKVA